MMHRQLEATDTLVQCDTTFTTVTDTLLNDDCSSTANWNVYGMATTLSIVGGQLNVSSSTSGFGWGTSQYFTTQAGVTYTVSFYLDMGSCAGSTLRSEIIDNTFSASTYGSYSSSGHKTYTFTATGSGFGGITFVMNFPGAACGFNVDSVLITYDTTVVNTISCDTVLSNRKYRYGFNKMEKDDEVKGQSNSYDFGARIYDPRLGRWLSMDAYSGKYPGVSPYCAFMNNPNMFVDPTGDTITDAQGRNVYITRDKKTGQVSFSGPGELSDAESNNLFVLSCTRVGRRYIRKMQKAEYNIYPKVEDVLALVPATAATGAYGYEKVLKKAIKKGHFTEEDLKDKNAFIKLYGLTYSEKSLGEGGVVSAAYVKSIELDTDAKKAIESAIGESAVNFLASLETLSGGPTEARDEIIDKLKQGAKVLSGTEGAEYKNMPTMQATASTSIHEISHGMVASSERKARRLQHRFERQYERYLNKRMNKAVKERKK